MYEIQTMRVAHLVRKQLYGLADGITQEQRMHYGIKATTAHRMGKYLDRRTTPGRTPTCLQFYQAEDFELKMRIPEHEKLQKSSRNAIYAF